MELPSRKPVSLTSFHYLKEEEFDENDNQIFRCPNAAWIMKAMSGQSAPEGQVEVKMLDSRSGISRRFNEPGASVGSAGFSSTGKYFYFRAVTSFDWETGIVKGITYVHETESGRRVLEFDGRVVLFHPEDRAVVLAGESNCVVHDLEVGATIGKRIAVSGQVVSAALDPRLEYVAYGFSTQSSATSAWAGAWHLSSGTSVLSIDHQTGWEPQPLDGSFYMTRGQQAVVGIEFSPDMKYVATLSARQEIDGDRVHTGWQPRRARVWELSSRRPVTEWIQVNPRHTLSQADLERLESSMKEASGYVRELTLGFAESGKALRLKVGGQLVQEISLDPQMDSKELINLAETMAGLRFNADENRLVALAEDDRIARWKRLKQSAAVRRLLDLR